MKLFFFSYNWEPVIQNLVPSSFIFRYSIPPLNLKGPGRLELTTCGTLVRHVAQHGTNGVFSWILGDDQDARDRLLERATLAAGVLVSSSCEYSSNLHPGGCTYRHSLHFKRTPFQFVSRRKVSYSFGGKWRWQYNHSIEQFVKMFQGSLKNHIHPLAL